jgi:hypothetical protein
MKISNPKCRLHWCLIEFIGWRYRQSCWHFRPALRTIAPLTFSLVSSLPPKYTVHTYTVCKGGGGYGVIGGEGASDK